MHHKTFLTLLEQTVRDVPDKIAVMDENSHLTYQELLAASKTVGYGLSQILLGQTQKPVVVFMEKSGNCLAAMLGVLYSGNIYVPMDVKTPVDRLNSILGTLESRTIITSNADMPFLERIGYQGELLVYEEILGRFSVEEDTIEHTLEGIQSQVLDVDLMYILFTSGSTGVPKGVAVMHRCLLDYVYAYQESVGTKREDIVGNQAPFYADMSLKDIYMSLEAGASICIIPQKYFMSPKKLLQYLDSHNVTFLAWVPTAYRLVAQFQALEKVYPKSLNRFLFSGESMPVPVYEYWRKNYPRATYIQLYGPTEITGACTNFVVTRSYSDNETIPIGKPFSNTGIVLLDENNQEVPKNDRSRNGEICVYGTCLTAGYYNNPQKTAEVFVQNPLKPQTPSLMYRTGDIAKWDADGNLVFMSRKDYQIKHGGKRIELGEIEAAVQQIPEINACCCVHKRDKDALVLFYIGKLESDKIIRLLQSKLPKYMIPTIYHSLNELPTLPNGKINRKLMDSWANEEDGQ